MRQTIALMLAMLWAGMVMAENLPMPPRFTADLAAQEVLRAYPLGVIPMIAARSHHGQPDHKITLPNNMEGWVYELYAPPGTETHVRPDGTSKTVRQIDPKDSPHWTYTLVFGEQGMVNDVLYNARDSATGPSALQIQRGANPVAQKLPGTEHGAHFSPGGGKDRY